MREHDAPGGVERARRQVADEQVVGIIDVGPGDVPCPGSPVVRVVPPDDGPKAQRIRNFANAVL